MSCRSAIVPLLCLLGLLAHTAPAPAKPDALPPPVVPYPFGVNIHFTGAPARDLDGIQNGGFRWVRMDFQWAAIERTRGVYDFSAYDTLLAGLEARHLRPLFILDYGNDLYQSGSPRSAEARAAFVRFAVAAVKHFQGRTILWEIWNEPNIGFWQPKPSVEEYGQLALETAQAIKAADPDATVLAPGASTIPLPFLEALFKKGLLRWVDAVSLHPYRGAGPETAADELRAVRGLIARYAPAGKEIPLVSSEWGYSTVGVSEQTQAQYLAREWLSNLAEGVRLSVWYDWHEDGQSPTDPEHHFGTVRWDDTPKPAYLAAKTLTRTLAGYRFLKRIPLASDEDYLLLFAHGHDSVKLAAWTTGADHKISLPVAGPCTITTLLGETASSPAGAPLSLTLSGSPQYLDVPAAGNEALFQATSWSVETSTPFYTAGQPVRLQLAFTNTSGEPHRVGFQIVLSTPVSTQKVSVLDGEDIVAPGATLRQGASSAALSRVPVRARVAVVVDGVRQPYPQDVLLTPTDPLQLGVAPATTGGFRVEVSNPAGTAFTGRLEVRTARKTLGVPVRLKAGQSAATVTAPGSPGQATLFLLRDSRQSLVAYLPARRYVRYPFVPEAMQTTLEGDKVASTVRAAPAPGDALSVQYAFAPGWTYWRTGPTAPAPLPDGAVALGLWVNGDGSGNRMRMRFRDSTGQTFQPDGDTLDWTGWRYVTFPLIPGAGQTLGHWGGDGIIHPPIQIESLFLLDSQSGARKAAGTVSLKRPSLILVPAR